MIRDHHRILGLFNHCFAGALRVAETGNEEAGDGAPLLASDLVNVDFPQEQDFKHHVSRSRPYRRQHFTRMIFERERRLLATEKTRRARYLEVIQVVLWTIALIVLIAIALRICWDVWQVGRSVVPILVAITVAAALLLTLAALFIAVAKVIVTQTKYAENQSFATFRRGRQPPKMIDLAVRFIKAPWRGRLVRETGPRWVLTREFSAVRPIWVGGGEIKCGCGPKGVSVEHDYGFLYLLKWEKIALVYDSDAPDQLPFDQVGGVPVYVPDLSHKDRTMPNPDAPFAEALQRLGEVAHEAAATSNLEAWAPESIHVRLTRVDPNAPFDELIIPREMFEKEAPARWQDFMLACWEYKYFPQESAATGKSIGSIDFREHDKDHPMVA